MNEIIFGQHLEEQPGEVAELVKMVESGNVKAQVVASQKDGDVRYWAVDLDQSPILRRLMDFANAQYKAVTGELPARSFVMMNLTDSKKAPQGSGGAWHRDSFPDQYKAFVYLVDVDSETQGPFAIVPKSNSPQMRAVSALAWLAKGRKNHDQPSWVLRLMERTKMEKRPILAKAGMPFFANTSLIHRGMPITEGRRIAATAYLFKQGDQPFIVNGQTLE